MSHSLKMEVAAYTSRLLCIHSILTMHSVVLTCFVSLGEENTWTMQICFLDVGTNCWTLPAYFSKKFRFEFMR